MSRLPKELIEFFPNRILEIKPDITGKEEAALIQELENRILEIKPDITEEKEAALTQKLQRKEGPSYYSLLGLSTTATNEEIRKAYKNKSLLCHPDKFASPDKKYAEKNAGVFFKLVSQAYEILSDVEKRCRYDKSFVSASSPPMTDKEQCIERLRNLFIPENYATAFAENISYQKLVEALKNYSNPDLHVYLFIVFQTTDENTKKEFIEDIRNKARHENKSKAEACRHENGIAENFDACSLSVRTDIEQAVHQVKIQSLDGVQSKLALAYAVTQKFLSDFMGLIKEGERRLQVVASDLSSGKENLDQYGRAIDDWLKALSEKIDKFCQELSKEQICIEVNKSLSSYEQLKSMIQFFHKDNRFDSYDQIDGSLNSLFQRPEEEVDCRVKSVPMSTFTMQAKYLSTIARKLDARLDMLEQPSPGCYRGSQSSSPNRVTRVFSPTMAKRQLNPVDDLENKIDQVITLTKRNSEIDRRLGQLLNWKAAFGSSHSAIETIEKELENNANSILTNLMQIKEKLGSDVTASELSKMKNLLMFKAAVLTGIELYCQKSEGNSSKSEGIARAKLLEKSLKTIKSDDVFFDTLWAHLGREEGSGFFKHAGRLNEDSLDTYILNAVKSNTAAFGELQKKVPGILPGQENVKLRDLIVKKWKEPQPSAKSNTEMGPSHYTQRK